MARRLVACSKSRGQLPDLRDNDLEELQLGRGICCTTLLALHTAAFFLFSIKSGLTRLNVDGVARDMCEDIVLRVRRVWAHCVDMPGGPTQLRQHAHDEVTAEPWRRLYLPDEAL